MKNYRSFLLSGLVLLIAICSSVSARAQQADITPLLDCIEYDAATDAVTAYFGYDNREDAIVQVLIGSDNRFVPNPANRGQNTLFLPGLHQRAFSVTAPGNQTLQWLFLGQALTFTHNQQFYCRQPSNVAPAVVPLLTSVQLNSQTGQATATFGYFSAFGGTIGKGSSNYFSFSSFPSGGAYPGDRGQPTNFQAGLVRNAFQVTFNPEIESAIVWNLLGQTVVAVAPDAPPAPPPPPPPTALFGVSGRVLSRHGLGVFDARLTLTNVATQAQRQTGSNIFGNYQFSDVPAGDYLLEVRHRRYNFTPRVVQVSGNLENLNITAEN